VWKARVKNAQVKLDVQAKVVFVPCGHSPDSIKIALTYVSHLIIGSVQCAEQELISSCLFLISCHLTVL